MSYIEELGEKAKIASKKMLTLDTKTKNRALLAIADELINKKDEIKAANKIDLENGKASGLSFALLDRLELTDSRIEGMAQSLREIAAFVDPIGEILTGWNHENGMSIAKKRVPLGVIGMIYESRPNVTIDSAGLSIKSSNAVILRGSSNAINSNIYLNKLFNKVGEKAGLPKNSVQLIESSVQIGKQRFAIDDKGHIHRYMGGDRKNEPWHWAGSTSDKKNPLSLTSQQKAGIKKAYPDQSKNKLLK